eukprot:1138382-Pelagomonas_calceolata.AAC.10
MSASHLRLTQRQNQRAQLLGLQGASGGGQRLFQHLCGERKRVSVMRSCQAATERALHCCSRALQGAGSGQQWPAPAPLLREFQWQEHSGDRVLLGQASQA